MKRWLFAAAAVGTGLIVYREVVRPWWQSWGIDRTDVDRTLPGDGLVPDAPTIDTRSIEIAAPPSDVWPWLVQMGYGRAGWYSYDSIDMVGASSRRIVPEWQSLAVGDVLLPPIVTAGDEFPVRAEVRAPRPVWVELRDGKHVLASGWSWGDGWAATATAWTWCSRS